MGMCEEVVCCKRKRVVFWNTNFKLQKLELDQKVPNPESAFLVLPKCYHELVTRFCGSYIIQCLDFVLFEESYLCFASVSDTGNFNWRNTKFCLVSLP